MCQLQLTISRLLLSPSPPFFLFSPPLLFLPSFCADIRADWRKWGRTGGLLSFPPRFSFPPLLPILSVAHAGLIPGLFRIDFRQEELGVARFPLSFSFFPSFSPPRLWCQVRPIVALSRRTPSLFFFPLYLLPVPELRLTRSGMGEIGLSLFFSSFPPPFFFSNFPPPIRASDPKRKQES